MTSVLRVGKLRKMRTRLDSPVAYELDFGDAQLGLNEWLGQRIVFRFAGEIRCIHCNRKTKKSYGEGYCFPCLRSLAECDACMVRPELCHHHLGTCREPAWGEEHCMRPHVVYLANAGALKVGITRDAPTRWIDQGASQALAIRRVASRRDAGTVEVAFKKLVADKTNWRKMLQGEPDALDLAAERERFEQLLAGTTGELPGERLEEAALAISYPVRQYPSKISSLGFDKHGVIEGELLGIKGQYLLLDTGVLNVRNHTGYIVEVAVG